MILSYYQEHKDGIVIHLKVIPNSYQNEISGLIKDANGEMLLKVKVAAIADNGKANKQLIAFLAGEFGLSKSDIEIISGKTARNKKILLHTRQVPESLKNQQLISEQT